MSRKLIPGFDYRTGQPAEYTRAEWRKELRAVIDGGGFRTTHEGETFAHNRAGRIVFEVYAVLPA